MGTWLGLFGCLVAGVASLGAEQGSPTTGVGAVSSVPGATPEMRRYVLPVLGGYEINAEEQRVGYQPQKVRRRELARRSDGSDGRSVRRIVVDEVDRYAIAGTMIVGRTTSGFFIYDTRAQDQDAQLFSSRREWCAALAAAGISGDIPLHDPDVVAGAMPDHIIRPWQYRIMHGAFGLCDDAWAGIIQLLALALSFVIGLWHPKSEWVVAWSLPLAALVVFSQIVFDSNSPGVGLLVFPLLFAFTIWIGQGVRELVAWLLSRRRMAVRRRGAPRVTPCDP